MSWCCSIMLQPGEEWRQLNINASRQGKELCFCVGIYMNGVNAHFVQMEDDGIRTMDICLNRLILMVFSSVTRCDLLLLATLFLLSVFTISSLSVIGNIVGIQWFSTSSLSEPDCHHYLLCQPNDHRLSNSTHRRSAVL